MNKLHLKLICTAALIAALPLAGCSSMSGNQTTQNDSRAITRQAEESCPDCENNDCPDGDCNDECPEDDKDCNDGCPDCPKKKRKHGKKGKHGKDVAPKGSFKKRRKPPVHPNLPVEPPKDDDIILPDPPVEGEQPKN